MSGRLLLVGWEVGDAQCLHRLIDAGELPTFGRLLEAGIGGPLMASRPLVDAALWASLATGKRAWQHGVLAPSRAGAPDARGERRALALWDILGRESRRSLVVGWPTTHGPREHLGALVSDRFPIPTAPPGQSWPSAPVGTYDPPELAERLDPCRIRPDQIGADAIAEFVPGWQTVDQSRDRRLAQLRILLAADLSFHAALTALMSENDWSLATVRFRSIGEIWRLFGADHLAGTGPFRNVVRSAYGFLDRMLGAFVAQSGPDTAVVVVTAGGVAWSPDRRMLSASPQGYAVFSGPGFVSDELLHGTSALDVAPTLLQWFGLRVGEDMEGQVRCECFAAPQAVLTRPTWETGESETNDPPSTTDTSQLWNYACACLDGSRLDLTLPALERLFVSFPENLAFAEALFKTQLALGLCDEAAQTLKVLEEVGGSTPGILVAAAELAMVRKETRRAREMVRNVVAQAPLPLGVWRRIGLLLAGLREWEELEKFARRLIQHDDRDEIAWLGLAEASLRLGNPRAAAAAAQQAIKLRFYFPEAHMALARALAQDGMPLAAIEATERLLKIHPDHAAARVYLRRLRRSLALPRQETPA